MFSSDHVWIVEIKIRDTWQRLTHAFETRAQARYLCQIHREDGKKVRVSRYSRDPAPIPKCILYPNLVRSS